MHAAGADGHPGHVRPPGKRMRAVGRVLFWIGAALIVVCLVIGTIVAITGFTRVADTASDTTVVAGPTDVTLEEGERLLFYVPGEPGEPNVYSDSPPVVATADANCTVTGPAPREIRSPGAHRVTLNGETRVSDGGFEAESAGTYTTTCAPVPDVEVTLGPPTDVGGILGGIGGVFIGVFGAIGSGVITILGLVLWLVGRSTMKKNGLL
ncbi:hypothetical protein [Brevibacterium yomogidense]|uniref:hypothetical protein n=1 Tax=Brevibacterium yomogidense TaxID=946573 RepID=UPI0018DFD022|nr:hypothetical protein [Brevibacterium yomogidense]